MARESKGKTKAALPVWIKFLLIVMLLLLTVSVSAVAIVNIQHNSAEKNSSLPSFGQYKYCAVSEPVSEKYQRGSLLLIQKPDVYAVSDEVVVINRDVEDASLIFNDRYLLVRLGSIQDPQAEGVYLGHEDQTASFYTYEIVGKVTHIVPAVGALYEMLIGPAGFLLFLLVPVVLTIIVIAIMVNMSANRQAYPERYGILPQETPKGAFPGEGELFGGSGGEPPAKVEKKKKSERPLFEPGISAEQEEPVLEKADVQEVSGEELFSAEPEKKRSRKERRRQKNSLPAVSDNTLFVTDEKLDLFEQDAVELPDLLEEGPTPEENFAFPEVAEPFPAGKPEMEPELEQRPASPFMDPVGRRAAQRAASFTPARQEENYPPVPERTSFDQIPPENVPVEAAALTAPTGPQNIPYEAPVFASEPFVNAPAAPPVYPQEDEAVAIYDGGEPQPGDFAPSYLRRGTENSLEELKAALREERQTKKVVDIVVDEEAAGLTERERQRIEKINSFDPDKMIEEIKRKNALYENTLNQGGTPVEAAPSAPEKKRSYPSRAEDEFYQANGAPSSPDEVLKKHQRDFDDKRFRPSFISVVGEGEEDDSEEEEPCRYHNRNDED